MTDPHPIFKFCDLAGKRRPNKAIPRPDQRKPVWYTVVGGLRAYRILQEILPYLVGQKLEEANRALDFFAPDGYRSGRFGGYEVWPENKFPLRKRGKSRYAQSLRAKNTYESELAASPEHEDHIPSIMDFCCMKIANALLQNFGLAGSTQAKLAKSAGLGRPTVIHHLKHLERDSFVRKEKIRYSLGRPGWLYRPSSKLLEIENAGKVLIPALGEAPENERAKNQV